MANQTVTVLEANDTQTDVEVLGFGRQVAASSKSLALATEDKAVLDAMAVSLAVIDNIVSNANGQATMANSSPVVLASNQTWAPNSEYETVAASQTAQVLGAAGASGDYIAGILVIPATTSPGLVTLLDNAISIPVFVGGAASVSNLVPFIIPLGIVSVSGAWKITTGANVSCIAIGNFT